MSYEELIYLNEEFNLQVINFKLKIAAGSLTEAQIQEKAKQLLEIGENFERELKKFNEG